MSKGNLRDNSVDKSIPTLENSSKVKQPADPINPNQIQHAKKVDEDFFKDIILKSILAEPY